jgi:pimeloyl-ACP methyl ester carboxylesterase
LVVLFLLTCRFAPAVRFRLRPPFDGNAASNSDTTFDGHSLPRQQSHLTHTSYTIEYLQSRAYGGGQIEFLETIGQNILFTRYLIRYPSDGLNIYGFANIPNDEEVHPIIIALHGYIDPGIYNTLDYTTHYADALAGAGYIVLHPNLRGYQPSDNGDNLFRVGMATDVLNLISLIQTQSGGSDPLRTADPNLIGLWGHSMGGGISTRVLTVSHNVRAAVLYGAMSGDEQKNYEAIQRWSGTRAAWMNSPSQSKR